MVESSIDLSCVCFALGSSRIRSWVCSNSTCGVVFDTVLFLLSANTTHFLLGILRSKNFPVVLGVDVTGAK